MPLMCDVYRVLKKDGSFFFSTHHPMVHFEPSESNNYFQRERITEEWDTIGQPVQVQFYRRSLTELFQVIADAGMYVAQLHEGQPDAIMKERYPKYYAHLSTRPNFLFMECKKLP